MKKWNWRKGLLGAGAVLVALASSLHGTPAYAETPVVLPEGGISWEEGMTVYYKDEAGEGDQYKTLAAALKAVYMSDPEGTATLYCKPGADVGAMTHGHVGDNLTIYGNDAYVSAGEHDIEIDTYAYDRETGNQVKDGAFLDGDITVTVKGLDGIAAWGQRHTEHRVTLNFEDCQNMNRVYFSKETGPIDISMDGCSFTAGKYANTDTSIYSNAEGTISISNTTFTGIAVPINLNNKASGSTRSVTVDSCTFIDCSNKATAGNAISYAAPVRVVGKTGTTTNVKLNNLDIRYSEGVEQCGNGDVLIGDGRNDIASALLTGTVNLEMTGTEATVMVQKYGYQNENGVVLKPEKAMSIEAKATDRVVAVNKLEEGWATVTCAHVNTVAHPEAPATCTEDGTEAYWACSDCDKLFSDEACTVEIDEPVTIKAAGHSSEKWVANSTEHWKECDSCGADFDVEGHSFGEWEVTEEPTAGAAGSKERACATCGRVETAEIPRLDAPAEPSGPSGEPSDKPSGKPADRGDGPAALPQTGDAAVLAQLAAAGSGAAAIAAGAIAVRKRR